MSAASSITKESIAQGGRAFGRVLRTAIALFLCVAGLVLMAEGALIPVKAQVAQILLRRAFADSLVEHRPVKPWPWADTAPVARIALPRLGVERIVLSGGSGQAMAFGPTLLPVDRHHVPVTIMAAHRDTHFAFLEQARIGDAIDVQTIDGRERHYRIARFAVVAWDRFAYPRDPARPLLALVTCYPFSATGHGPLRLVAWAEEVSR